MATTRKGRSTTRKAASAAEPQTSAHDARFLEGRREALIAELDVQRRLAESLQAEVSQLAGEAGCEVGGDDEFGEASSVTVDLDRDQTLIAVAAVRAGEIEQALERMDRGSYGVCRGCREPIARARLTAVPWADQCVSCKAGGLSSRMRVRATA